MTKTMNHTNCDHPATKAGRAACRKARAARVEADAAIRADIIADYHAGAEVDDLIYRIRCLGADFDPNADIEEIIASLF